jgi:hypothetical protein
MKHQLAIPENFDGDLFRAIYGYTPCSSEEGYLDVDESITDLSDCCTPIAEIRQALVDAAHDKAVAYVSQFADSMGLNKLNKLYAKASTSQDVKDKIDAIEAWSDNVMGKYLFVYKPAILSGSTPTIDYSDCGEAPYTFTEIVAPE